MSPKLAKEPNVIEAAVEQPLVTTEQSQAQDNTPDNKPTVVMTNTDAYIHERMKAQPKDLETVLARRVEVSEDTRHRLTLPKYFVKYSYDHSDQKGQFVFRWLFKNKQALDYAINVRNWILVNRRFFKDAPNHLFSSNGGVEEGDSILAFMPAKQALELRAAPGKKSKDRVQAQLSKHKNSEHYYEPSLDPEMGPEGSDGAPAGVLQEGRDF